VADSEQILASIRRRIATGELKPGDRVPSTRQITRRWGVAMATATRVLATLQREGLVVARPGIGTVVASAPQSVPPTPRVRTASPVDISRADVVRAAVAIADAEGSTALSMRRVATELGVATMSLYRHVPSKEELITQMIDAAFGAHRFTEKPPGDWLAALELAGRQLWTIFRRHTWVAPVMSLTRPQITPNVLAYTEWVLSAVQTSGLGPRAVFQVHYTLFCHVRGLAVVLEPEAMAEQETGQTFQEFTDTQDAAFATLASSGAFPTFQEVMTAADFDLDLDEQFEFGLRHLLAGLAGLPLAGR
jgi:AcrR family transcriptional regulator